MYKFIKTIGREFHLRHGHTQPLDISPPLAARVHAACRLVHGHQPRPTELHRHTAAFLRHCGSEQAAHLRLRQPFPEDLFDLRPINLEMDVTNQCNLRCRMCHFSDPTIGNRTRKDLTWAEYRRIADQLFAWLHRLCLGFSTEPALNRDLGRFVELAKQRRIPKVYLNTNGLLLKPALLNTLVDAGLDALNISLDAGTKPTYEHLRRGGSWPTLLANLHRLRIARGQSATRKPDLSLSLVLMRSNLDELPAFVRVAAEVGAQAAHLLHLVPYSQLDTAKESLRDEHLRCNQAVDEALALAEQLGVRLITPDRMGAEPAAKPRLDLDRARSTFDLAPGLAGEPTHCCPFPWHFMAMDLDGSVLPCGWWYAGPRMGNLLTDDFRSLWQGPAYRTLRRNLRSGILGPNCRQCPAAGMGSSGHADSFATRSHDWQQPTD